MNNQNVTGAVEAPVYETGSAPIQEIMSVCQFRSGCRYWIKSRILNANGEAQFSIGKVLEVDYILYMFISDEFFPLDIVLGNSDVCGPIPLPDMWC